MSISYGEAEAPLGATANAYINSLYQQAVSEGVSVFVASGDEGASISDANKRTPPTGSPSAALPRRRTTCRWGGPISAILHGHLRAPTGLANGTTYGSALSYVPEIPWDDSCAGRYGRPYWAFPPLSGARASATAFRVSSIYLDTTARQRGA